MNPLSGRFATGLAIVALNVAGVACSSSTWGVVIAEFGACGDAGAMDRAGGAVGTFALRASGSLCLADVHATLFAFTATGEVKAARFDADGLTVTGLPAWLCN